MKTTKPRKTGASKADSLAKGGKGKGAELNEASLKKVTGGLPAVQLKQKFKV
jgi:hypothetical protein